MEARNQYIHARTNLENVLGRVLQAYDVNIDEAKTGIVGRAARPDLRAQGAPGSQ